MKVWLEDVIEPVSVLDVTSLSGYSSSACSDCTVQYPPPLSFSVVQPYFVTKAGFFLVTLIGDCQIMN